MLFAPGLFSITIGCPSASDTRCVTTRVTLSVMPPGVYGTIQRMGLFGYGDWPHARPVASMAVSASRKRREIGMSCSPPRRQRLHRFRLPSMDLDYSPEELSFREQ